MTTPDDSPKPDSAQICLPTSCLNTFVFKLICTRISDYLYDMAFTKDCIDSMRCCKFAIAAKGNALSIEERGW